MATTSGSQSFLSEELHKKMCKKIADLTRVIDKLFRQYYEQNILFVSMKAREEKLQMAATEEIQDRERQIKALKDTIEQLQRKVSLLTSSNSDMEVAIADLQSRLKTNLLSLEDIQSENNILKQELITMKEEKLTVETSSNKCQSCAEHDVVAMKTQLKDHLLEIEKLKKANHILGQDKKVLNDRLDISLEEIASLRDQITSIQSLLDSYKSDNEGLQSKISHLKEKLKIHHRNSASKSHHSDLLIQKRDRQYWLETTPTKDKRDSELERLKQEVLRYKMELINRETNFNRVFTAHSHTTPVVTKIRTKTPSLKERKDHLQLPKLHSMTGMSSPPSFNLDFRK